jgi:anaerobic selenocysteine-containing dehydrogenase
MIMAETRPIMNIADTFWKLREPETQAEGKVETIVPRALEGGEWKRVMCKLCGNKVWCTAQVYVKDGLILSIAGDPENAATGGKLCTRGQAGMMTTYNPYRVKAPMKRTNPRKGLDEDPGWLEISWDEALDTVAEKMKAIRAVDPRRFAHCFGFAGYANIVFDEAFCRAFGSPYDIQGRGHLCPVHIGCSFVNGTFLDKQDVEYANYFLTIGGSLGPNNGSPFAMRAVARAMERGMKLVVVDPRMSPEGAMADEWIPIRPGGDLAFTLAMLHVMLHEVPLTDLDLRSIKERSNLVYLIGEDKLYVKDPATGKPLVWDPVDEGPKTFDDRSIKDYALEGTYRVDGHLGTPAFALIKERMAEYTPEWQEQHTTVPAETVRRVARDFVAAADVHATVELDGFEFPLRPAVIKSERGAYSTTHGAYQHFAVKLVAGLVGATDVPGGFLGSEQGPVLSPGPDGVVAPKQEAQPVPWRVPPSIDLREYYPHRHTSPYLAWKTVLDPERYGVDHNLDMLMVFGSNPIHSNCTPMHAIEAFKKIPFTVVIALTYDETTQFADILLPESTIFERYAMLEYGDHVVHAADMPILQTRTVQVSRPAIDPVWNTRQADDIYIDIAERAGFLFGEGGLNDHVNETLALCDEHKLDLDAKYQTPEIIDRLTRCHYGEEYGLDYFDNHAHIPELLSKAQSYNFYYYPWGMTRHPLYFNEFYANGQELKKNLAGVGLEAPPGWDPEEFWKHWEPIPRWVGRCDEAFAEDYDLRAMVWTTPQTRMCSGDQIANPWIREPVKAFDPYDYRILINTETARMKGLKDGDRVDIEAFWGGRTEGVLKLTELIHPEALGFPGHHGFKGQLRNPITWEGPDFNDLLSDREGEFDPVSCATDISPRVKITRLGKGKGGDR